jgi:hypothetical protein
MVLEKPAVAATETLDLEDSHILVVVVVVVVVAEEEAAAAAANIHN